MQDTSRQAHELQLSAVGLKLAGCLWEGDKNLRFIGLHGWLDNAASLQPLAQKLTGFEILTLDLAGHGKSDFRSPDSNYDLVKDVADIHAVSEQLGWQHFGLIGHSRGAMIAALYAATFPERVSNLVLIDGGAPVAFDCSERPARLARAIREKFELAGKLGSLFKTRQSAIRARATGFVPVEEEIAELLASRALVEQPGGFRWHADQQLKSATMSPLDLRTMEAFFSAIRCPVLQILGREGIMAHEPSYAGPVEKIRDFKGVELPGNHHLHIGQAEAVADCIRSWLEEKRQG